MYLKTKFSQTKTHISRQLSQDNNMKAPACTPSKNVDCIAVPREKRPFLPRLYFWLFIVTAVMAAFLFWSARNEAFINADAPLGINTSLLSALFATALSIMFAMFCFVRFLRRRSIAGGLFLTTSISTAIFLGTSQAVAVVIPTTATALSAAPEAADAGISTIIMLAQIGIFALWFLFLLLTIYIQVSPVKRIDKALQKIVDGDPLNRVHIGRSMQYRKIESKLRTISSDALERKKNEELMRQKRADAAAKRKKTKQE